MKITEYVKYDQHRTFLYEGLDSHAINEAREWERILRPIVEAQLTPDQINTLFQQAQQVATAGGANRTGIGKGVDAAKAAGEAFEKVKAAMQNSGPIQGFEAQYDKLAAKLKEKTGGDQGVMQYIQKYRDFATKHPVAQKVIYAAAIAALGALAVGGSIAAVSGGPIVLGLFKMTDRLLQGDKLTSAIWQGVKVAGGAAAAVGVGKAVRGALGLGTPTGAGNVRMGATSSTADLGDQPTARTSKLVNRPDDFGPTRGSSGDSMIDQNRMASAARSRIANAYAEKMGLPPGNHSAKFLGGVPVEIDGKPVPQNLYTKNDLENIQAAKQGAAQMDQSAAAGKALSNPQSTGATAAEPMPGSTRFKMTPAVQAEYNRIMSYNPVANRDDIDLQKDAYEEAMEKVKAKGGATTAEPELKGKALADKRAADMAKAAAAGADGSIDILNGPPEIQGNKQLSAAYKSLISKIQSNPDYSVRNLPGDIQRFASQNSVGGLQATKDASNLSLLVQKAGGGNMNGFLDAVKNAAPQVARGATSNPADFESAYESRLREELANRRQLPESQIKAMFRQVDEGVWDAVKKGAGVVGQALNKGNEYEKSLRNTAWKGVKAAGGAVASGASAIAGSRIGQAVGATAKDAAGAVAQKVGTVATNMTTKVTSDKLMQAWKTAGNPTDSAQVYYLMKNQGLDDATLASIFKAAKVRIPVKGAKTPAATPPAAGGTPPATPPQAPAAGGKQLSQTPGAVRKRNARAAAKAPPAPAAPAPAAPAPAAGKGFNVNLRQTPAQKNAMALTKAARGLAEEGETPLDKNAINKIFMNIAQAGAMGGGGSSPQQQQAPAAGGSQQAAQGGSGQAASDDSAPQQAAQGGSGQAAPAQGGGGSVPSGPAVPLNKSAINKIFMGVAQAQAG